MSSPHPPSFQGSGPAEQAEPAWNPGGRNRSYINRAGARRIGVIGFLLCPDPLSFSIFSIFLFP